MGFHVASVHSIALLSAMASAPFATRRAYPLDMRTNVRIAFGRWRGLRLRAEPHPGIFESVASRTLDLQLPLSLCWLKSEPTEMAFAKGRVNQGAVVGLVNREPLDSESRAKLSE